MSEEIEAAWANFGDDPKTADPNNFAFIVHAMSSYLSNEQSIKEFQARINKGEIISCSVIGKNEEHDINVLRSYCPVGVILKVPTQNIIHTASRDVGWGENAWIQKDYIENNIRQITHTPDDLLRATSKGINELIVQSKSQHGEVEIVGVFLNITQNNRKKMSSKMFRACYKKARLLKSTLGVPLFKLFYHDSQTATRPKVQAKQKPQRLDGPKS